MRRRVRSATVHPVSSATPCSVTTMSTSPRGGHDPAAQRGNDRGPVASFGARRDDGAGAGQRGGPAEFASHPQLSARNRWRPVRTPGGEIDALLPPVEVAGQEPLMGPVPSLGQHTEAVTREFGDRAR